LSDPQFLLRKAIERKVNQMFPDQYTPLYTMIAFTCLPYVEALRKEQKQSLLIDEIMKLERVEEQLESHELDEQIAHLMRASALNGH
jgi:kynurenine 3-monooxygenase